MLVSLLVSSVLVAQVATHTAPTQGAETAPIKVEMFEDFQCPFCKTFAQTTLPSIKKDYVDTGKVKIIHKDFPLNFHENSLAAATAGVCANDQKVFWETSKLIYNNQESWENSKRPLTHFRHFVRRAGGNLKEFNKCVKDVGVQDAIAKDVKYAYDSNIAGTPGFLINGKLVSGAMPYSVFKSIFDAELAGKSWEINLGGEQGPEVTSH